MNASKAGAATLLRTSWFGLLAWQLGWHALLPVPHGSSNWILALVAVVPLLPLTWGVISLSRRSLVLGMFLVMIYFIIAVMETWSNPAQRLAAALQIVLCCSYFAALVWINRPGQPLTK